jgi:membrane protein required for colicin V production
MTWVDLAILGVIAVSALLAFGRGLVREALGIGAWVGAAFVAVHYFEAFRPHVRAWIPDIGIADPVAIGLLFLVSLLVFSLIAGALGQLVRSSVLGGVDRSLGFLFGVLRGIVLVIFAYVVAGLLAPPERWPPEVLDARSLPYIDKGARWMVQKLPPQFQPSLPALPERGAVHAEDLMRTVPSGYALPPPAAAKE